MRDVSKWTVDEQKKYFAARFAFAHRSELCPHAVEVSGQQRRITWSLWFERMYGIALDEYQRQLAEDDYVSVETTCKDRQSDAFSR